ncbi:TRAP transporter small permease [Mangrovicoccus algicola]|uniref:TRAP transporter small permease protein n=1 Tax=Mangrovicoccus algicola TaxID=2771008 RepID=A0A8J6ZB48_9RHOB|nr:TRAP transporter small permease [Mangrovicoccus algicola]MBE3639575.1 TRAP transporter small permease [Mangrovicoccus algicola]
MSTLSFLVRRILAIGCGLIMAAITGIILVNALRRYTFGLSLTWGEELPVYLSIYGVMFGVALSYLQDRHMRFTIVTDFLSPALRERLFLAMDVVTAVCGGLLCWSGWLFAMRRGTIEASGLIGAANSLAESTGLAWLVWIGRMGTWQFALCVGGALLLLAAAIRFSERLRDLRNPIHETAPTASDTVRMRARGQASLD